MEEEGEEKKKEEEDGDDDKDEDEDEDEDEEEESDKSVSLMNMVACSQWNGAALNISTDICLSWCFNSFGMYIQK